MKILVAIANYGTDQLQHLERVVYEYTHLKNHEADVYIHTNVPVKVGDILRHPRVHEVFITEKDVNGDWQRLPFTTRKTLLNYPEYDLVIYSENDILIEEKNIDAYVDASDILDGTGYIPGFIRFEVKGNAMTFPEAHLNYKWDANTTHSHGEWKFMRFTCDHYGAFMLTKKQMAWVQYNNMTFEPEESVPGYQERTFKVKHCTSIYKNYGWTQVIQISRFDDFLIHHLSDKYIHKYGKRDLRKELKEISRYIGVEMPHVKYCFPYSYDKNVGVAYNREFGSVLDDDWVCLMDGDAMFLTPDYGHQIGYTIAQQLKKYPDGFMLTCYTNRVGCKQMRYPGMFDEKDITKHREVAMSIRKKHFSDVTQINAPISGTMMCIPKKVWNEVKFSEQGILAVDNDFSNRLAEKGYPVFRMDGLYVLHYYRMNEGKNSINHLI